MAGFCHNCGTELGEGLFCSACGAARAPEPTQQPRRLHRGWLLGIAIGLAVGIVALVGAIVFLLVGGRGTGGSTGDSVPGDEAAAGASTTTTMDLPSYLEADGAPVVAFHEEVGAVLESAPAADACRDLITGSLSEVAESPAALLAAAASLPDEDAANLAVNEVLVLLDFLSDCARGENPDPAEARATYAMLQEALQAAGVVP